MKEDAIFYYIIWAFLLIIALVERMRKRPFDKGVVVFVFLVLAVIVGCRYDVGADWSNYVELYYKGVIYDNMVERTSVEPLYELCQYIFRSIGFTHAVFFLFLSIVSLCCYYKIAKLLGIKNFMTVLFVYFTLVFLNYQFNVIRQGVMTSFVWLAFAYRIVGNNKASIISIIVALGFHFTALAFIPIVFLANRRFSYIETAIIICASIACLILDVSYKILSLFPILTAIDRTSNFVTSETFHVEGGLSFGMVVMLLVFLFVYVCFKDDYTNDSRLRTLANIILFDFFFSCMFNTFSIFQERVCRVMFFSMVFLLPLIVEKLKKPCLRVVAMTVIVAYALLAFPKTFAVHDDGYSTLLPYRIEIGQLFDAEYAKQIIR